MSGFPDAADLDRVRLLEELLINGWPTVRTALVDGWIVRLADGHTRRANAATPLQPGRLAPDALIDAIEPLFATARLPAVFRLTPLASPAVTAALDRRGYRSDDPSLGLCTNDIAAAAEDRGTTILPDPDERWMREAMAAYGFGRKGAEALARLFAHRCVPSGFATVRVGGHAVAWGMAAVDRGHVGLSDLVVAPAARGAGHGRRLTRALMAWGAAQGARRAYLQVREANAPARALYHSLGFRDVYRYEHRVGPSPA